MRPFIVIRQFESADMVSRKELIKQYAMSFAFDAFTSCLFREVFTYRFFKHLEKVSFYLFKDRCNAQTNSIVGMNKIDVSISDLYPACCVGGRINVHFSWSSSYDLLIFNTASCDSHLCFSLRCIFCKGSRIGECTFFSVRYSKIMTKKNARYLLIVVSLHSQDPITTCWVAEAYEPYILTLNLTEENLDYDIIHESRLQSTDFEVNRMKRTIIATISFDDHRTVPDAGWLNHFAIQTKFNFDKVSESLIQRALKHAIDVHFNCVEMVTTECQSQLRELLLKIGFDMRQVYHQYIFNNNNLRIMKSQMGINLSKWTNIKNKWISG